MLRYFIRLQPIECAGFSLDIPSGKPKPDAYLSSITRLELMLFPDQPQHPVKPAADSR